MNVTVNDERRTRRTTWLLLTVAFVIMAGLGLFLFRAVDANDEAQAKAGQLAAELTAAGMRAPSTERIAEVLGDDGGATCDNPNSALKRGALLGSLSNGAAGPGMRPVIADNRVVQAQLLIVKVYCPDEYDEFAQRVADLKLDDVAKG